MGFKLLIHSVFLLGLFHVDRLLADIQTPEQRRAQCSSKVCRKGGVEFIEPRACPTDSVEVQKPVPGCEIKPINPLPFSTKGLTAKIPLQDPRSPSQQKESPSYFFLIFFVVGFLAGYFFLLSPLMVLFGLCVFVIAFLQWQVRGSGDLLAYKLILFAALMAYLLPGFFLGLSGSWLKKKLGRRD